MLFINKIIINGDNYCGASYLNNILKTFCKNISDEYIIVNNDSLTLIEPDMCDSPFRNGSTVSECSGAFLVREDSKTVFESPETHIQVLYISIVRDLVDWINLAHSKQENLCELIKLRHKKLEYAIDILPTLVKNHIIIRYEDLINNLNMVLNKIKEFNIDIKNNIKQPLNNIKPHINKITKLMICTHPDFNSYYEIKLNYYDENINTRIAYYTQNLFCADYKINAPHYNYCNNINKETINVPQCALKFTRDELFYYRGPKHHNNKLIPTRGNMDKGWWWGINEGFPLDIPCLTISADGVNNHNLPTLMKVRTVNNTNNAIIVPLSYKRHWNPMFGVLKKSVKWENKINNVIYRGTLTGRTTKRLDFCKLYFNKYNVGLLKNNGQFQNLNYDEYLRNKMTPEEMIKYKYIISIEGNDKDSGLNWKLASNSVVIMTPPIYESWLMENKLEPYVHYIPMKDDMSDLDDILEWCKKNDDKCKEIAQNARKFIMQFTNNETEQLIFNMIKHLYQIKYNIIIK